MIFFTRFKDLQAFVLLSTLFASASIYTYGQSPLLSPQPRELHAGELFPVHTAAVAAPSGDTEDFFAAQNLEAALTQSGLLISPSAGNVDLTIHLLRDTADEAKQLLAANKLSLDAPMQDEGYVLISRHTTDGHSTVAIIGHTAAGLFYGAQTLKQMIQQDAGATKLWTATIRDWPAMKYRGVDDDLSRGPFPTLAFQKHQLEIFAAYKVNLYSPYFEHTLQYSGDPLAAPPGSSLTRAEAQELAGLRPPPTTSSSFPSRRPSATSTTSSSTKSTPTSPKPRTATSSLPASPARSRSSSSWFTQIAEDFPSPFLHIGADETFELGTGRTKADVDKRGLGPVYADFLTTIHTTLAPLHRRLLFWGDVATTDPSAIPGIPKDMIAIPWVYRHKDSYDADILPFKNAGIETWVAPGDANWRQVYPLGNVALDNISGFVEAGQRLGSTGELTTVWNDDGEGLFNQDWFGVLFGAAAGWQPGKSNPAPYEAAFGHVFYGDTTGHIDQAQKELMAAQTLIDVTNETFWLDPWSPAGLAKAAKLRANIPQARLHAEHAIELIETALATQPTLREKNALQAMELGARRIDFIGLKFQLSDEMREAYAKAYAMQSDKKHENETLDTLDSITSMNGRCQDLRDGYSMLKNLYRDSWLAENRPYWLDNVLVRYDLQIQQWQRRGDQINTLLETWQETRKLPPPDQANIPTPDPK